ncbi:MAG: PepSY domain-containing protein, partial [Pseudomonadales bacterium]
MRKSLVVLHRWFGLFIAVFLFISGLTGAIISWDHELDEALNPELYKSEWQGQPLPALELADRLEAEREGIRVTYMPLEHEPGHTLNLFVEPTSAEAAERIDYNQLGI